MDPLLELLRGEEAELDEVRYRARVVLLLLAADQHHFLAAAADELDAAAEQLAATGVRRALEVADLARRLGLPGSEPRLAELIGRADARHRAPLVAQRDRLRVLVEQVRELSRRADRLAGAGLERVRAALERLDGDVRTAGGAATARAR